MGGRMGVRACELVVHSGKRRLEMRLGAADKPAEELAAFLAAAMVRGAYSARRRRPTATAAVYDAARRYTTPRRATVCLSS